MKMKRNSASSGGVAVLSSGLCSGAARASAVDAAQKKQAVEGLSKLLQENYVFPDVAKQVSDRLAAQLASGAYDTAGDARAFAMALTQTCRR